MPQPTLAAADLGPASLLDLLQHDDPDGVLSIFADLTPGARGTETDLRNRLVELERRVRDSSVSEAIWRLEPDLADLVDPAGPGRGRALFVPLDGSAPTRLVTHLPLANRVVLDERPFVHPLLEYLERDRPAGVVLVASERAELLEWRDAGLLVLAEVVAEEDSSDAPLDRDQRNRRARERGRRFLDRVSAALDALTVRHGWERLVLSGDAALTGPLVRALPPALREQTVSDSRHLIDLDSVAVEHAVADLLERHRAEQDVRAAQAVRVAALTGQGGALGLSEVAAALNDARVSHLLYDPGVRYAGAVTMTGRIVIPPERDPLGEPLIDEPRLTERLVERCLTTGARITPVSGPAAAVLADADGVAARLRW